MWCEVLSHRTESESTLFWEGNVIMAAGAKPALDPALDKKDEASKALDTKPASLKERIIQKLTEIFEHNEKLGPTR
jgi:hypothetical protein